MDVQIRAAEFGGVLTKANFAWYEVLISESVYRKYIANLAQTIDALNVAVYLRGKQRLSKFRLKPAIKGIEASPRRVRYFVEKVTTMNEFENQIGTRHWRWDRMRARHCHQVGQAWSRRRY